VIYVEITTMMWRIVEGDSMWKRNPPKRRRQTISQVRGKGGMKIMDRGKRHSALIVVRMDTRLRSVGHFTHTYVRRRT